METLGIFEHSAKVENEKRKFILGFYKKYWDSFLSKLSCSQKLALKEYKRNSWNINSIVRWNADRKLMKELKSKLISFLSRDTSGIVIKLLTIDIEKIVSTVQELETIFLTAPKLKNDLIVFRGVGDIEFDTISKLKKGKQYTFTNYISTSLVFQTAFSFSSYWDTDTEKNKQGAVVKFILPKNTQFILLPGGPVQDYGNYMSYEDFSKKSSYMRDEHELVLNKNCTFMMENIEKIMVSPSKDLIAATYADVSFIYVYTLRFVRCDELQFTLTAEDIVNELY